MFPLLLKLNTEWLKRIQINGRHFQFNCSILKIALLRYKSKSHFLVLADYFFHCVSDVTSFIKSAKVYHAVVSGMVLNSWFCKWKSVYWSRCIKFRQSLAYSILRYFRKTYLDINDQCPLNKSLPCNSGFVMVKMIRSHYSFPKHFLITWVKNYRGVFRFLGWSFLINNFIVKSIHKHIIQFCNKYLYSAFR